ncbi:MAG: hypothetical protein WCG99_04985 [Candidatus Berkelbacteria bacterium]
MRGEILKKGRKPAFIAVVVTVAFLLIFNIVIPILRKPSNAAASFQANYDSGSLNANFSLGSGTGSTDTALPTLNPAGYGGTNSLSYSYDGTSTLKYPTASNLPADKGSVEMKFQKSAYGDAANQDKGSMYGPEGMYYDNASGFMYMTDYYNNRIIKSKIDGTGWQTFGHYGTGGMGQFNGPTGIIYEPTTDYLYIFDACNGRIVKTKMDGTGWQALGMPGSGVNQFATGSCNYAGTYGWDFRSLTLDPATGYLYIADRDNNRVVKTKIDGTGWSTLTGFSAPSDVKYDSATEYLYVVNNSAYTIVKTKFDGTGWATLGGFNAPVALDYDNASGYLYISDQRNARIVKTKFDGTGWATLGGFNYNRAIFFNSADSYIYTSDKNNNRIVKTQIDGTGWTAYGSYYNNTMKFNSNLGAKYYDASSGYYYIADSANNRIVKTKSDGTGWQTLGGTVAGSGTGQFNNPNGVAYDSASQYLYIMDSGNNRVVKTKFDGTGWAVGSIPIGGYYSCNTLSLNTTAGQLFFSCQASNDGTWRVRRMPTDLSTTVTYSNAGGQAGSLAKAIWYDEVNGWIYNTDSTGTYRVYQRRFNDTGLAGFGTSGSGSGQFSNPSGIYVDSSTGLMYISDTSNGRVVKTDWGANSWTSYGTGGSGTGNFSSPGHIQYNSSDQYMYISDTGNSRIVRTKIDGSGWAILKSGSYDAKEKILYSAQSTDDSRLVYDVASRKLRFYLAYSNKAQFVETPTLSLTDAQWYTVKASFNKAAHTVSIDLDGVNQATNTYDTDWGSLSYGTSFYIGARNGSTTDRWDGMIDDISVNIESVDTVAPTNPTPANTHFYYDGTKAVSYTSDNWGNSQTPYITWSGATDASSGIKGYYVYLGTDPTAEPNSTSGILTPNLGARYFKTHVGIDGAEQNITPPASTLVSGVTYYLILSTQDNDLNTATKTSLFTYKYDGAAPAPPEVVNVSPVGCSTSSTFTFTWDAITDPVSGIAGYDYKNGSSGTITNAGNVGTLEKAPYQEGDNIIYIRTRDNAGNTSSWQTAVYCSTGIAYIIDGPTVVAGPSSITVNWVSSKTTTSYVQVYEGNTYISEQGHTSYDITHNVKVVGLEPEKTYRYKLVWTDSSGNLGESSWYETKTATAPTIKDFSASVNSPTQAILSWKTSDLSSSRIEYGENGLNLSIDISGTSNNFTQELKDLHGSSSYQIRIIARTVDGFPYYYAASFETPPTPIVSLLRFEPVPDSPQPAVNVSWITNVETTSSLYYGVQGSTKQEVSKSDKTKEHTIKVENLADNTTYEGYVGGIDNFGNIAKSDNVSFKTKDDTRAPRIDNIMVETSNIGSGRDDSAKATIAFSTDEVAKCFVEYGEGISSESYSQKTSSDDASAKNHLLTISNLKPQTPYHFRITCLDKAENKTESPDQTVISGEITQSVFNIILKTLNNLFGWLGKVM